MNIALRGYEISVSELLVYDSEVLPGSTLFNKSDPFYKKVETAFIPTCPYPQ